MYNASDEAIAQLIEAGESFRCERKRNLTGNVKEKVRETICALLNDITNSNQLAVIAIGVNDDGSLSGLEITDQLELEIQDIRGEGKIIPIPTFSTKRRIYRGRQILCVEVSPAISTPVKYDGRIWVRPGNSNRRATADDERRLNERRRAKEQPDDAQVLEHFRINDLNIDYFKSQYLPQAFASDILKANGRTTEEQLASTKMVGTAASPHPTVLGMLCLGLSTTDAIPGAYVQFLRINGPDMTYPVIDESTIQGHIADVIQQTEAKFAAHNHTPVDFTSRDKEQRTPQYPKEAFQQLFRNAVLHRSYLGTNAPIRVYWYSNRIEITNPGGPFGIVTEANFGKPGLADYRNPNLAGALKDLDYVQKFGAGISVARKALHENGNPDLELEPTANFITAVMRQRP
jgi:ATP-dependent DNA helicase RecG